MNRQKTLEIMHSRNGRHKIIFIYSPLKQRGSMKAYQKFFLNGQLLRNCINSTALYYSTVSALGGDAFDNAQANCVCEGR